MPKSAKIDNLQKTKRTPNIKMLAEGSQVLHWICEFVREGGSPLCFPSITPLSAIAV